MSQQRFIAKDAFHFGWVAVKRDIGSFLAVMIIILPVMTVFSVIRWLVRGNPGMNFLFFIISILISAIFFMALIEIGLRSISNEDIRISDILPVYHYFWRFLVGYILYVLIVAAGLLLLIIPGVILAVKYQFFGYFIIGQGDGPIEALKRSGKLTKGIKGHLFIFDLMFIGAIILGYLVLIIGQLIATPIAFVAMAYVYRILISSEGT